MGLHGRGECFLPGNKAKVSTLSCNALEVLVDVIRGKGNEKAERNKTVPFANDILVYIDNSKESLKKKKSPETNKRIQQSYRNKDKYNIKKCIAFLRSNSNAYLNTEIFNAVQFVHT